MLWQASWSLSTAVVVVFVGACPFLFVGAVFGLLSDETQIWLEDLRVVFWCWVFRFLFRFFNVDCYVHGHSVMYWVFASVLQLLSGPSLVQHRPNQRKKKNNMRWTTWRKPIGVGRKKKIEACSRTSREPPPTLCHQWKSAAIPTFNLVQNLRKWTGEKNLEIEIESSMPHFCGHFSCWSDVK